MSDNTLGEKVDTDAMREQDLQYPGSEPPEDMFADAEDTDAPFEAAKAKKAAKPTKKPRKVVEEKSEKKPTLQLQKFREIFGTSKIRVKEHTIYRKDGNGQVSKITFGLRGLNYADYTWALESTQKLDLAFAFAYNLTMVAISVCSLGVEDEAMKPLHEVFGMASGGGKDPNYPEQETRFAVAEAMLGELQNSLYDLVDELNTVVVGLTEDARASIAEEKEAEGPLT